MKGRPGRVDRRRYPDVVVAVVPLQQSIELDPRPESAAAGRRFLRQTLRGWAVAPETVDQALLITGELVSNAILHAGTPIRLEVSFAAPAVRVAVRDHSPAPPSVRDYRNDSMTGRGLGVVGSISVAWGVEPFADGKSVWAIVDGSARTAPGTRVPSPTPTQAVQGQDPGPGSTRPSDPMTSDSMAGAATGASEPELIRFADVPIGRFLAMQQHHDGILREVELTATDPDSHPLVRLARKVGPTRSLLHRVAVAARRQGNDVADLTVSLRREDVEDLRVWLEAIADAEALPRRGHRLSGPASRAVIDIRNRLLDQIDLRLIGGPAEAIGKTLDDIETAATLGLAFEFAPAGLALADVQGRLLRVNRRFCLLIGGEREDLETRWLSDLFLADDDDPSSTSFTGRRVRRLLRGDGSVLSLLTTSWVIPGDGNRPPRRMLQLEQAGAAPTPLVEPTGTHETTATDGQSDKAGRDDSAAPRLAMQLARLQSATARLSRVRSMTDVADVILDETTGSIDADRAALWALGGDGHTLELLASRHYADEALSHLRRVVPSETSPAEEVLRTGDAVLLPSPHHPDRRFPDLGDASDAASFTVPLFIESRPIGILNFAWQARREMSNEERRFILALGDQCAQALDRARMFEAEKRNIQRQRFLAEASRVLAESLDFTATAAHIARIPVPDLADSCSVMVLEDDDRLRAIAHAHVDPARLKILEDLKSRRDALPPDYLGRVAHTGEPLVTPIVRSSDVDAITDDPELRSRLRALDIHSSMAVPLRARGHTIGLLGLQMSTSNRHFREDNVQLVLDLADRAAVALDNARTFQFRNQVAQTLQESLRPPQLPTLPGAQLAARYQAGSSGMEVGGDFYDVFDSEGEWAVVLGDVCGKGAAAAAITSMVRYSLRALAIQRHQPAAILTWLNEALIRQAQDEERFCTVAYARLVPSARGLRATVCSGGHPLPMVVRADGHVARVGAPGGLIGLFPDIRLLEQTTELRSGDALVLYTDGVTEAHRGNELFGDDRLSQVLGTHAGDNAEEIAGAIHQAVDDFATPTRRDDLALLVLRVD
jgi:PAS domain S-box-containing protein